LQPDPIVPEPGNPQALNRFAYCLNNPTKYTDPTGHYVFEEGPNDPWIFSTAAVRSSHYWTHPEGGGLQPLSDEELVQGLSFLVLGPAVVWATAAGVEMVAVTGIGAVGSAIATAASADGDPTNEAVAAIRRVWDRPLWERGRLLHRIFGENLPPNHPVVDKQVSGTVTSIKSLDLGAQTYQSAAALTRKVQGYIDKVAAFRKSYLIQPEMIQARELLLIVPERAGTAAQMSALEGLHSYAQEMGVILSIVQFP
jgi:hypothetical protein